MGKVGNPRINKTNVSTRITKDNAREFQKRSAESRKRNCSAFAAVRALIDQQATEQLLPDPVVKFWAAHCVPKDKITPMMAEITPIYSEAIRQGDLVALERIYRLLGVTFESNKEHNINVSVGNTDDKPFEINYIVDGIKQNPEMVEVKQDGL